MAVQLQGQGGLAAHDIAEKADDEGIGAAGEVGDVGAVELGMFFHETGPFQDHLPHGPVHVVVLGQFFGPIGQHVKGNYGDAAAGELGRNPFIGHTDEAVVRPAEDNHAEFLRILLNGGQPLSADFPDIPGKLLLRRLGRPQGRLHPARIGTHLPGDLPEGFPVRSSTPWKSPRPGR